MSYQAGSLAEILRSRRRAAAGGASAWLSRNVVLLGLTSLVTDISSEMVAAVLPLYLVYSLEMSPLQLGVIDGLYHGASVLVRVVSGIVADRWRRLKEVAAFGYALSAICKLGLLAAGSSAPALAAVVVLDRSGKGIRAAPRDALLSLSAPAGALGAAFGVHRALDTVGAMLGPLAAFGLLAILPGAFHAVFVVSFCIAIVGVALLALLVEGREPPPSPVADGADAHERHRPSLRDAAGLLRLGRFRSLVVVGSLLAAGTLSDGLVYLVLKRRVDLAAAHLPLLYVGTALVYATLALPMGRLADAVGRGRVLVAGYALLGALYLVLLAGPAGWPSVAGCMLLLGASYAATDGVLMALASPLLPGELRTTGFAVLTTCTSLARLLASVVFGAVWSRSGVQVALIVFLVAAVVATLAASLVWAARAESPD